MTNFFHFYEFPETVHYIVQYYTDKNSLIFQGYFVDRCPTLEKCRFTSVNFNQNLLVATTFVKWRKLICAPDERLWSRGLCDFMY